MNSVYDQFRMEGNVAYLLSRARVALVRAFDAALADLDITSGQGSILMMLASGRFTTAAELAREMYADSAAMTRMLDRLERRGLVTRSRHGADRRVMQLDLTAEGKKLARRLPQRYKAVIDSHFAGFTAAELDTLKMLLRKTLGDEARLADAGMDGNTYPKS